MQNYNNMEFGIVRLIGIFIVASADVGFAIYDRYAAEQLGPPVSYVAHLTGALAGLTIGLLVLKNFEQKLHEQLIWWVALGVYAACTLFGILFNVFNPDPFYPAANWSPLDVSTKTTRSMTARWLNKQCCCGAKNKTNQVKKHTKNGQIYSRHTSKRFVSLNENVGELSSKSTS